MKSKYIIDPNGRYDSVFGSIIRYGIGLPLLGFLLWVAIAMCSCKTVQVSEKVNVRDSVVYNFRDSIIWHHRDSVHLIEQHVTLQDSSHLVIKFGQGGGTYNSQTGEATNVSGVQHTDTHHEKRDSTAYYRNLAADYQHKTDSLKSQITMLQTEYNRAEKNARNGYDRFCSWWFWITAILLLAKVACWVMEKIPATAPYIALIRRFVPFL